MNGGLEVAWRTAGEANSDDVREKWGLLFNKGDINKGLMHINVYLLAFF